MGRYSRKDMIEFAKFAKSYQSSKKVEEAYEDYRRGVRLITRKDESLHRKILRSNIVYLNGKTIKDRYHREEVRDTILPIINGEHLVTVVSWDSDDRILVLKSA